MTFQTDPAEQPSPGPAPRADAPDRRRTLRMAGVFVLVVTVVATVSWFTRSSDTTEVTIRGNVTRVEVSVSAGDIEIVGGGDAPLRYVRSTDDGMIRSAQVTHQLHDGTLRIEGECTGNGLLPAFGCHADVAIVVPDGLRVVAETSGGSVHARDVAAPLRARSTAGDVVVTGLHAAEAHLTSSAGAVEVDAVVPPRSLDAESSAGPVSVRLPSDETYDVEAKSRAGDATVDVQTSYSSVYKVRAFASDGPVTVTGR